jgi:2,3-diketo-5-methylthio-1-phosphopentane phosphatase
MKFDIKCDFDGTITNQDTTDFVLSNFADSKWEELEKDWKDGKINSSECMIKQAELINTQPQEIIKSLNAIKIDPYINELIKLCKFWNVDFSILSDGYNFNIKNILSRINLENLKIESNELEYLGNNKFKFIPKHHSTNCKKDEPYCKCSKINNNYFTILIGDGKSDFCAAEKSDFVFAKNSLLSHCIKKGIPHASFKNFRDVTSGLKAIFMNQVTSTKQINNSILSTTTKRY